MLAQHRGPQADAVLAPLPAIPEQGRRETGFCRVVLPGALRYWVPAFAGITALGV